MTEKFANDFDSTLKVGNEREREIMSFLRQRGHVPIPIPGYFKGYDFFLANTKQAYEVKQDWKCQHTGNLVVEVAFGGKPSGLSTTLADWWVFHTGYSYIFIRPDTLRNLLKGRIPAKFIAKGDEKEKTAHLIQVAQVNDVAEKVVEL